MKTPLLIALVFAAATALAQQPGTGFVRKQKTAQPMLDLARRIGADLVPVPTNRTPRATLAGSGQAPMSTQSLRLRVVRDSVSGLPIYIENRRSAQPTTNATARVSATTATMQFLGQVRSLLKQTDEQDNFAVSQTETDELGQTHLRLKQTYAGIPVQGSELVAHVTNGVVTLLNGRYRPIANVSTDAVLSLSNASDKAFADVKQESVVRSFGDNLLGQMMKPVEGALCIFPMANGSARLTYALTIRPNLIERWEYVIDAQTGEVLEKYNHTCSIDGPAKASAKDLNGIARSIQSYLKGSTYYLIDVSRPMFNAKSSTLPGSPVGAIWTIDASNTYGDNVKTTQLTSTNNTNWSSAAVSAHYNAGVAYDYYLNTHKRSALNGSGGTMISVINMADDDGKGMDNAYWNGQYMAYGNGRDYFKPLAGGLDVAGHEMTHGVIGTTANLKYQSQSGAINESMADVFGALIDRGNWTIGEDVIKNKSYPSGALRDLSNPNQGGKSDPGYQPKTMSQYISTTSDNGGVHINSGIPNYAFYLFASNASVGKDKAEKVYFRALTTYLTATSQFVDLRLAVIKAATDLYGAGAEVAAAKSAFDAVGIVESTTSTPTKQPDLPTANGQDLLLVYGTKDAKLYSTVLGSGKFDLKSSAGLQHRPSITDDGKVAYFVSTDKKIRGVSLSTATPTETIVQSETIWSNAAISRDGSRLAGLTEQQDASVWVYSFEKKQWKQFKLYNPTYSSGITTGNVKYADSFEWDFTGEYLVYDAYNELKDAQGNAIDYWDVGFIHVWDGSKGDFADGHIEKLFTDLGEGVSIGNPSYSKNSPNVLAFDYEDETDGSNYVLGVDLDAGNVNTIYENNTLGFPSYSRQDNRVVFNTLSSTGTENIGAINLAADKISASGSLSTLYTNAKWPVWYTQASRALPTKANQTITFDAIADQAPSQTSLTLKATSTSGLTVLFSVIAGPAEVTGNVLKITGTGAITVRAYQDGNSQFYAATPVDRSFSVKATQTITFNAIADRYTNQGDLVLTATSSANLPVSFSVRSGPATLTGSTLKITGAGTVTVRAAQDGNAQFLAATPVDRSFVVQTVTGLEPVWSDALLVYPNPVNTTLTVELPGAEVIERLLLKSVTGATLLQPVIPAHQHRLTLEVGQLPKGIYFLQVQTPTGTANRKVVKE